MKFKTLIILSLLLCYLTSNAQKIFMTGDSHVSIKVYPREVKRILEEAKPEVDFSFWGKGGAGFYSFNDNQSYMDSIYNANPDILIVHLGTNGSYAVSFDPEKCFNDISTFHSNVRSKLPDCKVVYVTPFYNKNHPKGSGSRKTKTKKSQRPWQLNTKTRECSDVILSFADSERDTFVIDNNADAGTIFVDDPELIRSEFVHLTDAGYKLLAKQVTEKLLLIPELWQ